MFVPLNRLLRGRQFASWQGNLVNLHCVKTPHTNKSRMTLNDKLIKKLVYGTLSDAYLVI